jgi:hypothetical protein
LNLKRPLLSLKPHVLDLQLTELSWIVVNCGRTTIALEVLGTVDHSLCAVLMDSDDSRFFDGSPWNSTGLIIYSND